MMTTSYEMFLQLPLFQGINKKTLTTFIEKVKFNFVSYKANKKIAEFGKTCKNLVFILQGEIVKEISSEDKTFSIIEKLPINSLIEPTSLFGLNPTYHATYTTTKESNLLVISKDYILDTLMEDNIFKLNFLNILSGKIHQQHKLLWYSSTTNELLDTFKRFILQHCEYLDSPIILKISMPDLAFHLRDTRLNVSKMLNKLDKLGLIDLKRLTINILKPIDIINLAQII